MHILRPIITCSLYVALCCGAYLSAEVPVAQAFKQLQDEATTDSAAKQLAELGGANVSARSYIAQHLPTLIEKARTGPVWLNAVRLAGELRIVKAIPVLAAELQTDNKGGSTTFAEEQRLDNDPVGKALARIGDASTQAVGLTLNSSNKAARWRATLVLFNINSAASRRILQQRVSKESDKNLREFITNQLAREQEKRSDHS